MRVLIISQYYDPEPIPKPSELADELSVRGHEVVVLTGLPNYPTGRLATGYRLRPWMDEVRGGARVLRVFELPYHGRSAIGRFMNYGTFMIAACAAAVLLPRVDVAYVWHPPLTVGVAAAALRAVRGTPFVYDVQDVWPDEAILAGAMSDGRVASVLRRLESAVYARAAHVIVATAGARENLLSKGLPPAKVTVVPNWVFGPSHESPDSNDLAEARKALDSGVAFTVTFAGNIGVVQALETVLLAAQRLSGRPDIQFRIVGDGSDQARLERLAAELKLVNLRFIGRRPSSQMPALLAASDALLVHLKAGPLGEIALPTKTLVYLAAAKPLIVAMGGEAARIARESGAGLVVPSEDPVALADAVERLAAMPIKQRQEMGTRGREFVNARFPRVRLVDELERLLLQAAQS